MKDDFCIGISCMYCGGRDGQHKNYCLLNEVIFCTHCGSKNHRSNECLTHKPISHIENLQYILHENSNSFISRCSLCSERHDSKDCPKQNIPRLTEKKSPYQGLLGEISIKCMECGRRNSHSYGCSQFVGVLHKEHLRPFAEDLGTLQASQAQDTMQTYQVLKAQIEIKYYGQIPARLREALDIVEKELSDLVVKDLMTTPRDKEEPFKGIRYNL